VKISNLKFSTIVQGSLYCGLFWDFRQVESPWFGTYNGVGLNRVQAAKDLRAVFSDAPGFGHEAFQNVVD
jgi:hypothetical protein